MLYCRDLPRTVKLKSNSGQNLELVGWQTDLTADSYWYMSASGAAPVFVIFDTAGQNSVMKSFGTFGCMGYSDDSEGGVQSGIVSSSFTGPDRYVLGSFKLIMGPQMQVLGDLKKLMQPQLIARLPKSLESLKLEGIHTVSPGPTFQIVGKAPDLAHQFLKYMVDAQR